MRVSPIEALDRVAGYAIVNDISLPHRSFYRPSIRLQARVGLCPVSHNVVPRHLVVDPDALTVRVLLDGQTAHLTSTADRVRPVGRLLADISAFMTLMPGDILTLGYAKATKQIQAAKNG